MDVKAPMSEWQKQPPIHVGVQEEDVRGSNEPGWSGGPTRSESIDQEFSIWPDLESFDFKKKRRDPHHRNSENAINDGDVLHAAWAKKMRTDNKRCA